MQEESLVLFEVADKVATVTLNRPQKLNATNQKMMAQLSNLFQEIKTRADVSVVVLKGAGRAFCSGHDVSEKSVKPPYALSDPLLNEQRWVMDAYKYLREMFWEIPQPIIAQVHGYCFTIGIELAMYCDLVYVSDDLRIGWRPISGSGRYMHMWPWLIGVRKAKELLYTGRYISGTEAAEYGMVNASMPLAELDGYVKSVAEQIAQVPLSFLAIEKQTTNKCWDLMGAREGQEYSATLHSMAHRTEDGVHITDATYTANWKQKLKERDGMYQPSSGSKKAK